MRTSWAIDLPSLVLGFASELLPAVLAVKLEKRSGRGFGWLELWHHRGLSAAGAVEFGSGELRKTRELLAAMVAEELHNLVGWRVARSREPAQRPGLAGFTDWAERVGELAARKGRSALPAGRRGRGVGLGIRLHGIRTSVGGRHRISLNQDTRCWSEII